MITCRLQGGIGNLMFQIAFIEYEGMMSGFKTGLQLRIMFYMMVFFSQKNTFLIEILF